MTNLVESKKQKRIVSIVARKNAIVIANRVLDDASPATIRKTTKDCYWWMRNREKDEVQRELDLGRFINPEAISIKLQAALNDASLLLENSDCGEGRTLQDVLRIAEELYRISDELENATDDPNGAKLDEAARIRADQTGMPYPTPEEEASPEPDPAAEDKAAPQPTDQPGTPPVENADIDPSQGDQRTQEAVNDLYDGFDPAAEERAELIAHIEESGTKLGFDRSALDKVIADADSTYPGKRRVDELNMSELRGMRDRMDAAILRQATAESAE